MSGAHGLLWHAAAVFVGLLMPIRITSRLYLAEQLRKQGIAPDQLPASCVQDLADECVRYLKVRAGLGGGSWRAEVTEELELDAAIVADLLSGRVPADWEEFAPLPAREILARHGIPIPPRCPRRSI